MILIILEAASDDAVYRLMPSAISQQIRFSNEKDPGRDSSLGLEIYGQGTFSACGIFHLKRRGTWKPREALRGNDG